MRAFYLIYLWLLLLILDAGPAFTEDLGVIGPVHEIAERDLIEVILERLRAMESSGELNRLEDTYRKRVIAGIERPQPVDGIRPAESSRTHYIDPTFTLNRDVIDEHGQIMFRQGMRINPLDYAGLSQVLVFFDGDDEKQREFVDRYLEEEKRPVKPIMISGAPLELMREWQREVFFDQGGVLSRHFRITGSPAMVRQEGKRLRIDEIHL